jgi:hypothetical protein
VTTSDDIRGLIAAKAQIDWERIRVEVPTGEQPYVIVGISACTETEQRRVSGGLNRDAPQSYVYKVVRDENPDKPPAYDLEKLREIMVGFGDAPDGHLDKAFAKQCAHLPEDISLEDMLKFIRNMRDECAYCAGASDFVMRFLSILLDDYPESEEDKKARRSRLRRV